MKSISEDAYVEKVQEESGSDRKRVADSAFDAQTQTQDCKVDGSMLEVHSARSPRPQRILATSRIVIVSFENSDNLSDKARDILCALHVSFENARPIVLKHLILLEDEVECTDLRLRMIVRFVGFRKDRIGSIDEKELPYLLQEMIFDKVNVIVFGIIQPGLARQITEVLSCTEQKENCFPLKEDTKNLLNFVKGATSQVFVTNALVKLSGKYDKSTGSHFNNDNSTSSNSLCVIL